MPPPKRGASNKGRKYAQKDAKAKPNHHRQAPKLDRKARAKNANAKLNPKKGKNGEAPRLTKKDPHAAFNSTLLKKKKEGPLTPAQKRYLKKQEQRRMRHEQRKEYLKRQQELEEVDVPCCTYLLNGIAFVLTQIIGLALRFVTLVFNIALILAVLIKLDEDTFAPKDDELRRIFDKYFNFGVDISSMYQVFIDVFKVFNIAGTESSPALCAEVLMSIWVIVPLLLAPFLFFLLNQDYLLRIAVVMGHRGEQIDNFILAGAYASLVTLLTDIIAKIIKFTVYVYAELFLGFWIVFIASVEGVSEDNFANVETTKNTTVNVASSVEFETCFPNDENVAIVWIVICSLIFVLVSTPLLVCICLPGMFSNAQRYEAFDKRVVNHEEDAPLPTTISEFLAWSRNVFGLAQRLYCNCIHPIKWCAVWGDMILFFLNNLKAIIFLSFGVWTTSQAERFQVKRRAAKVDWNPVDADNQQQRVIALFGKQYGLFWFLVPGGALLSTLAEGVNDPPIMVNTPTLQLKDGVRSRFIGWFSQIVAYVTLLLPCFFATEASLLAAFAGVLPNWLYHTFIVAKDWERSIREDALDLEEEKNGTTTDDDDTAESTEETSSEEEAPRRKRRH